MYIFRFTDFKGMLNKNPKQNIVNSMWSEDFKGYTYTRSMTNVFLNIRNILRKTPVLDSPFNKVADLQAF